MLKTFSIGGVHPHENKLSAHQPIITAEVPAKAVILLGQHIGAPAKPVVAKGDVVNVSRCVLLRQLLWRTIWLTLIRTNVNHAVNVKKFVRREPLLP